MHFIHRGIPINPSVTKRGHAFVARVSILEEDGGATSFGDLGHFANRESAFAFAVRCGTAFVDGKPMPFPPCNAGIEKAKGRGVGMTDIASVDHGEAAK